MAETTSNLVCEVMRVAQLGRSAIAARAAADRAAIHAKTERARAREVVNEIRDSGVGCNCDLDNWEPEKLTGHSWVCRIHKAAVAKLREAASKARGEPS